MSPQSARTIPPGVPNIQTHNAHMRCLRADGRWAPCGPGNEQCGPTLRHGPRFHLTDRSCSMNDPNGPFYDAKHDMYHVFYQDHLWAVSYTHLTLPTIYSV